MANTPSQKASSRELLFVADMVHFASILSEEIKD
jgi:hypothetical protein